MGINGIKDSEEKLLTAEQKEKLINNFKQTLDFVNNFHFDGEITEEVLSKNIDSYIGNIEIFGNEYLLNGKNNENIKFLPSIISQLFNEQDIKFKGISAGVCDKDINVITCYKDKIKSGEYLLSISEYNIEEIEKRHGGTFTQYNFNALLYKEKEEFNSNKVNDIIEVLPEIYKETYENKIWEDLKIKFGNDYSAIIPEYINLLKEYIPAQVTDNVIEQVLEIDYSKELLPQIEFIARQLTKEKKESYLRNELSSYIKNKVISILTEKGVENIEEMLLLSTIIDTKYGGLKKYETKKIDNIDSKEVKELILDIVNEIEEYFKIIKEEDLEINPKVLEKGKMKNKKLSLRKKRKKRMKQEAENK